MIFTNFKYQCDYSYFENSPITNKYFKFSKLTKIFEIFVFLNIQQIQVFTLILLFDLFKKNLFVVLKFPCFEPVHVSHICLGVKSHFVYDLANKSAIFWCLYHFYGHDSVMTRLTGRRAFASHYRRFYQSESGENSRSHPVEAVVFSRRCDITRMIIPEWARRNERYWSHPSPDHQVADHKIILNRASVWAPFMTIYGNPCRWESIVSGLPRGATSLV